MFSCLRCCTKERSYTINKGIQRSASVNPVQSGNLGKEPKYRLPDVILPIHKDKKVNGDVTRHQDDAPNQINETGITEERKPEEQVIQKHVKEDTTLEDILNATQLDTRVQHVDSPDDKHGEDNTVADDNKSIIAQVGIELTENETTYIDNASEQHVYSSIEESRNPPTDDEDKTVDKVQTIEQPSIDIDVETSENTTTVNARIYIPSHKVDEAPEEPKQSNIEQSKTNTEQLETNISKTNIEQSKTNIEQSKSNIEQSETNIENSDLVDIAGEDINIEQSVTVIEEVETKIEQSEIKPEVRFMESMDLVDTTGEGTSESVEKHAKFSSVIETIKTIDIPESDQDLTDDEIVSSARTSTSEQLLEGDSGDVDNSDTRRREGFRQAVDIDKDLEINVHPKSEDEILCIKNAIAANEFLENILKENNLDAIIDAMYPRELNDGDIIIEEGEPGNHLYISDHGTFEVYIANKLVTTFSDKRVFGELAVLYNSKRMATIKTASTGKVWVLHRTIYQQSLVKDAVNYLEETKSFLTKVPLVNQLKEDKLNKIANLLRKEFFKTGKVIVQEGDEGDKFYIIRAGTVSVTKQQEGKVAELGRGAFFGERALLYADRRQATVTADGPVECLTLTRSEFVEHFDDRVLEEPTASEPHEEVTKPNSIQPSGKYSDIEINSLEIVTTLGVGGFGRVELVQHKQDKNLTFALKYLRKVDMVQQGQVEHVFNEKNIQIQCNSSFIVNMYKTFQDGKYLYFLMESCLGGDLWSFLQKRRNKCVPNQDARFYAACVLEALAYLHERNFIFRDLKPENLLIDSQGYLKLTDFGFAKHLGSTAKTFTFAGTPEYVAPEIIYNKGHEKSVDYWAFGVLIFELLVGRTPFRAGDDHMKTYNRILKGINSVPFPPTVSRTACSIVVKLCRPTPTERLGAQKNGIADIRAHKWFQGFDWNRLRNRKYKAPFVPKLNSNIDTRNFEYFKPDTDIPPAEPTEFHSF